MNDEYLWSKKGSNPEIERLEGLLSQYRCEPDAVPVFVSPPLESASRVFGKRFAWIVGIAAPSFALALFGFWFINTGTVGDLQVRATRTDDAVVKIQEHVETSVPVKHSEDEHKTERRGPILKTKPTLVKTIYRSQRKKADQTRTQTLTAKNLTFEEKYAYDRLRLALSIAGTKLKVVQDTIDRSGELEKRSIRNDK